MKYLGESSDVSTLRSGCFPLDSPTRAAIIGRRYRWVSRNRFCWSGVTIDQIVFALVKIT